MTGGETKWPPWQVVVKFAIRVFFLCFGSETLLVPQTFVAVLMNWKEAASHCEGLVSTRGSHIQLHYNFCGNNVSMPDFMCFFFYVCTVR